MGLPPHLILSPCFVYEWFDILLPVMKLNVDPIMLINDISKFSPFHLFKPQFLFLLIHFLQTLEFSLNLQILLQQVLSFFKLMLWVLYLFLQFVLPFQLLLSLLFLVSWDQFLLFLFLLFFLQIRVKLLNPLFLHSTFNFLFLIQALFRILVDFFCYWEFLWYVNRTNRGVNSTIVLLSSDLLLFEVPLVSHSSLFHFVFHFIDRWV